MDFDQPIEDIIEELVEDIVDEYIDDDEMEKIAKYCRKNGITTKSDFEDKCYGRGLLGKWMNVLRKGIDETIESTVIYHEDGIDILNSTNTWSGWSHYFKNYGMIDDVATLGAIVLREKFEEYGGDEVIIDDFYSHVEDYEE